MLLLSLVSTHMMRNVYNSRHGRRQSTQASSSAGPCERLAVGELVNVGPREEAITSSRSTRLSWTSGFFEYESCDFVEIQTSETDSDEPKPHTTVLTVANRHYSDVLSDWVKSVKRAHLECHVFALDNTTCTRASDVGCKCLRSAAVIASDSTTAFEKGWHNDRVSAVKYRFEAASILLRNGYDVLLHDADVFFLEESIALFMSFVEQLQEAGRDYELIIQDNGARKDTYDRLNWGFSWMKSTQRNHDLLQCTIERWDDQAFQCSKPGCNEHYSRRSQPRINHIIESSIEGAGKTPRLCMLSNKYLQTIGIKHFTGYSSAQSKKTCSKSQGYLMSQRVGSTTVMYEVPSSATLSEQRLALINALNYAHATRRKLQIPKVYWNHDNADFCLAFDIKDDRIHGLLVAGDNNHICGKDEKAQREQQNTDCLTFSTLRSARLSKVRPFNLSSILLCDPTNTDYAALHECHRKHPVDEI